MPNLDDFNIPDYIKDPIAAGVVVVDGEEPVEVPKNEPKNSEKEALKNLEG